MSLADCARAAHDFEPRRYLRFEAAGHTLGWIRPPAADRLSRFPDVFSHDSTCVQLSAALDTLASRDAAIAQVLGELAAQGTLTGWRDELYAVAPAFGDPPLFHIERAAARLLGVTTYAVHVNGVVDATHMWVARRSATKPIDPGMLDNLVGGGLAAGLSVAQTLVKEGREEAGIPADMMARAVACGRIRLLREVPEGVQSEIIFVHDLVLPAGFQPVNQDGEVAELRLLPNAEVLHLLRANADITLDASLVMMSYLLRQGLVSAAEATPDRWFLPEAQDPLTRT